LLTPYVLARGGSEIVLGLVLAALNIGSIVGGVIVSAIGGRKPRMHGMMRAMLAAGLFLALTGVARDAWAIGVAMFLFMACFPFMNAPYMSIMQAKIAPDVQGRVFAAIGQLSSVMVPLAYLAAGPLADRVFEPAVGTPAWQSFAPLVGEGAGAGMALMLLLCGVASFSLSLFVYALPTIRRLETALPDHAPETA
jgi:DHA3 family macrolide efflux protein-like MFS transporter